MRRHLATMELLRQGLVALVFVGGVLLMLTAIHVVGGWGRHD